MRLYFVQEEEEVKEILRRLELLSLVQFVFFPLFVNRKRERERMEERRKKGSGKKEEKSRTRDRGSEALTLHLLFYAGVQEDARANDPAFSSS